jgi:hypothetical protein
LVSIIALLTCGVSLQILEHVGVLTRVVGV